MRNSLLRSAAWLWVVAMLFGGGSLEAQTNTGRISGTVVDSSGGVLPGVMVTVTEGRTGYSQTTVTDDRGAYVIVSLPIGTYTVTSELQGFKKEVKTGYNLVADGRVTVDFSLSVGAVEEVITVTSQAGETVNTVSGEVARVIDREQVQNLALNGRNYMQLASLIPGSPLLNDDALNIMTGLSIATSVNGSRNNASLLTVDGGFNMDSGSNNSQISNVGIDFIEEVNIKTSNFSAEYGRNSGAAINVVTRSGSNTFTGSLFEYHRNEGLDANTYLAKVQNVAKAPLKYNNFGGSLGGPILKGRLFFFAGEEWRYIRRSTNPTQRTLPTRAMRQGDFSALTTAIRDPLTGQPFAGNVIPAGRITPDGRAIANVYNAMEQRAVSYDNARLTNNALFQADNPFDFRQDLVRFDWMAGSSQRYTVRLIRDNYDLVDPFGTFINSQLPTIPTNRRRPGRNYQLSHNWTLGATMVNEFKTNASWNGQRVPPEGEAWMRDTYGFTFPQLFSGGGRFENSIPDVDIAGYATFRGAQQSLLSPTTDISVSNNLTWLKGAHTLKTGGMIIRNRKDQNSRSPYAGFVSFNSAGNPQSTSNAFADALLGNFRTYREAQLDQLGLFRFWQAEGFVSDNWRVSRNLSVEAGLRYTWHQPIYTQSNNMASFDPALYDPARAVSVNRNGTLVPGVGDRYNGMVRAGEGVPENELGRVPIGNSPQVLAVAAGAPRGFYKPQHLLGPRFSFAWTPTNESDMAIRGGFGLFHDRPEGNLYFGAPAIINNPPYSLSAEYENGNLSAPGGGAVPALAPIAEIGSIDPGLKVPRSWNWSVTMQRQLRWGIFGEVGYVGSKGQNLLRQPDINQPALEDAAANAMLPAAQRANNNFLRPFKGFSAIRHRLSDAESDYHALQLFVSRRKGTLRWTLNYTLSRARDDASGNGENSEDFRNKAFSYGPSDFDRPHILVGTWTWQLPIFREERGVLGRALGGWEVSGIGRLQSGQPFTATGPTSIGVRRADLNGDPYVPESERIQPDGRIRWLNTSAFSVSPEGRRGNTSRGQFRGHGLHVWDLSFRKGFRIVGDTRLQLQADVFNLFDRVSFRNPESNMQSSGFGFVNATAPPRQVQLGIRLTF